MRVSIALLRSQFFNFCDRFFQAEEIFQKLCPGAEFLPLHVSDEDSKSKAVRFKFIYLFLNHFGLV